MYDEHDQKQWTHLDYMAAKRRAEELRAEVMAEHAQAFARWLRAIPARLSGTVRHSAHG